MNNNNNDKVVVQVSDASGKIIINKNYTTANGLINISTQPLSTGSFIVKIINANGESYLQKVVVVK